MHLRTTLTLVFLCLVGCDKSTPRAAFSEAIPTDAAAVTEAKPKTTPLRIVAWNIESGGNDPSVIAEQLANLGRCDVYALSEVSPKNSNVYSAAVGASYQMIESESGGADRLQIIFDSDRFDLIRAAELGQQGDFRTNDGNHRSPLLVHLRDRSSNISFQLTANHLSRTRKDLRDEQASALREWARGQTIPTIAVGDFNFDYSFQAGSGNPSFATMMRDSVWLWVKPQEWVDTQWSERTNSEGEKYDGYPDSMLDFAFVAGPARAWDPICRVITRPNDFPDNEDTSDHRPIELILTP